MNEEKLTAFVELYRSMLREEVTAHRDMYAYGPEEVDAVVKRMAARFN